MRVVTWIPDLIIGLGLKICGFARTILKSTVSFTIPPSLALRGFRVLALPRLGGLSLGLFCYIIVC